MDVGRRSALTSDAVFDNPVYFYLILKTRKLKHDKERQNPQNQQNEKTKQKDSPN